MRSQTFTIPLEAEDTVGSPLSSAHPLTHSKDKIPTQFPHCGNFDSKLGFGGTLAYRERGAYFGELWLAQPGGSKNSTKPEAGKRISPFFVGNLFMGLQCENPPISVGPRTFV